MEEDIKILEELINAAKECNQYRGNRYYKAMEKLIKRNKELEGQLCQRVSMGGCDYMSIFEVRDKYIPKSKVQEKIEEYKQKRKEDVNYLSRDWFNYEHKIYALQELLED